MAACVTPAAPDMILNTASPRIVKHRRNIVRLMIAEHPESCIICSKGNRCQLRQIAANLGIGETDLYHMPNFKPLEQANPFIIRDLSKCILCGKCIRADHELVAVGAIDYNWRGFDSRPATAHELGLEQSSCTFCGTCVSLCPTGALSTKNTRFVGSPEYESDSICGFCGVGCKLAMGAANQHVVEVNPADCPDSINGATLCVRGHFAHDYLNSADRLVAPLVRKSNDDHEKKLVPVSWDEALEQVATRITDIKRDNGPQSVAFLGSSKCSNEENYLLQKIARVFVGTNNVDNGGYIFGQSLLKVFDEKTAGGYRVNRLADLANADVILTLGADPNHSVPVVSYYLKRAARQGIPLIVVDPRRTELSQYANIWLPIKPRTDIELLNGLAARLCEREAHDSEFIDRYTEGFNLFRYGLSALDLDKISQLTNLSRSTIDATADLLKGKKVAIVIGQGILQQNNGMHTLGAIFNLSVISGSLGSGGAGIYVLSKENNQAGAMDMGAAPDLLPGRQSLGNEAARKKWEKDWKINLSPDAGLNLVRMIEAAETGKLKALYIMGENPLRALPQRSRVKKALQKLDFLVVQDIINSETAQIADAVLPGAAISEKRGSITNLEGRIQSFRPVVAPPGKAKADWEILDLLAARLRDSPPLESLKKIRKEIQQLVPMYGGLDGNTQSWLEKVSSKAMFNPQVASELISFYPVVSTEEKTVDKKYPFTAIVGTQRFQLASGTRTAASDRIRDFTLAGKIEISPQDAADLDVSDEDTVTVSSPYGDVTRAIRIKSNLNPGHLFVPTGVAQNEAMELFSLSDLTLPGAAGWKTCEVKIDKTQIQI
jgi:formate dehydrogenase alpha subunit